MPPLGLHVHLCGTGPTLRFVVWFEGVPRADAPARAKPTYIPDPLDHPFALHARHPGLPAWLDDTWRRAAVLVTLPHLPNLVPVPLPGHIDGWDLSDASFRGRKLGTRAFSVPAWVVPAHLSLEPLRALLASWREHVGPGFLSPHAEVVTEVLSWLHTRLLEAPLLPTLGLHPMGWAETLDRFLPASSTALQLAWAPPVRLAELNALRAKLLTAPFLAAAPQQPPGHRSKGAPATWRDDTLPQRLAVFFTEALHHTAASSGAVPRDVRVDALTRALRQDALKELHAAHGNCLDAHHAIHQGDAPPKTHLHGRLHPADDGGWSLELGLAATADAFLPASEIVTPEGLTTAAVDHDDTTWMRAASVLHRDWQIGASSLSLLRAPELLAGRAALTPAQGASLLTSVPLPGESYQYRTWLESIGSDARAKAFTAFTAAPAATLQARLRVRWDLDPTRGETLHDARFVPSLDLVLGDLVLDAAQAEALLRESSGEFVRAHGQVLRRVALEAAVALLRAREKVLSKLRAGEGLSLAKVVDLDDQWATERAAAVTESLFSERWQQLLDRLRDGGGVPLLDAPKDFQGTLRPYQQRGLSWMHFLVTRGFGGCLADDMGLGKTVQVLALLATRRAEKKSAPPDLVVCPTAVVHNWARESRRFTPKLRVGVHQGAGRAADGEALERLRASSDVVITSYPLLRRDSALFEAATWSVVIVDEAQNLKNPEAQQTRAAKALTCSAKLCLTGTPVENQLRDLWSVFDLAIPGLLGGQTRFAKSFVAPLRTDAPRTLQRLSSRVGPFLLRRTKRDPAIAGDLPPKQEQEAWCELTPEQVTLYQAMTEATLEGIVGKDGVARRAHILAALTRFKQICNHPESFHPEHPDRLLGRSGKLDRTLELVEELVAEEQRVLIFTQFTEMGEVLRRALRASLDLDADFYHGGLSAKAREEMVAAFNEPDGPPVLIVSLRAGGTGLNLTAASAVIHYDRWWNPAVEDQATDRAHRIGQQRMVSVFKLATRGTLEERVVDLLETKRALASQALGGSDASFITEMSDGELRAFLSLGAAAEAS
jgi:superfamily II DNA or RNA helicase